MNSIGAGVIHISQTKLTGSFAHTGNKGLNFISYKLLKRREEKEGPHKNRWVSAERDDGTAMGAISDWRIPSLGKPFFSLCHVQSVDKRHHPSDSLINCEMYSYLPLSYSRAPKTSPLPASSASPLPVFCGKKKQAGLHKDPLWEKKENIALLANFLLQDFSRSLS